MQPQKVTGFAFNATQFQPLEDFSPIPPGWYTLVIEDAEVRATQGANPGKGINITFKVTAGDYAGRKLFSFINVENANAKATEIGQRELATICQATGVIDVRDLTQFHGKYLQGRVAIEVPKGNVKNKEERNVLKMYKACEPGQAPAAQPQYNPNAAPGGFPQQQPPVPQQAFGGPTVSPAQVVQQPAQGFPQGAAAGFPLPGQAPAQQGFAQPVQQPAQGFPAQQPAAQPAAFTPPDGWFPHPQYQGYYTTATGQTATQEQLVQMYPPQPVQQPMPSQGFPQPGGFPAHGNPGQPAFPAAQDPAQPVAGSFPQQGAPGGFPPPPGAAPGATPW